MKSNYINGSDLLIRINGKAVGHATSHTATFSSETKDRAVKPVESLAIAKGLWKEKGVTGLSISISAEGLRNFSESESGFKSLLAAWSAGKAVEVEACERIAAAEETASPYLKGTFVITSLEESAAANDDATYSIQLENAAAPEVLDASILTGEDIAEA